MPWPEELEMLKKVRRQCYMEYWLAGVLFMEAGAMLAFAFTTLLSAPFLFLSPWRLPLSLITAGLVAVVYYRTGPGDEEIARRLDKDLASQERVQTLVENRGNHGLVMRELRRETASFFSLRPPRYRCQSRSFLLPSSLAVSAAIILVISLVISPGLSQSLARNRELQQLQEEAAASIEEIIQLLPEDPLAEDLAAALAELKETAFTLTEPSELDTLLREAAELLAASAEHAETLALALDALNQLMTESPAALAQSVTDPGVARELTEAMTSLAEALPAGLELGETLRELAAHLETAGEAQWQQLQDQLAALDPGMYGDSLQDLALAAGLDTSAGSNTFPGNGEEGLGSSAGSDPGSQAGPGQDGSGQDGQGSGAGTGSAEPTPSQYVYIPGEGEFLLSGEGEAGGYTLRDLLPIHPGLVDDYAGYFNSYHWQALITLSRSPIPQPLADYVRSYFEAIAPREGK